MCVSGLPLYVRMYATLARSREPCHHNMNLRNFPCQNTIACLCNSTPLCLYLPYCGLCFGESLQIEELLENFAQTTIELYRSLQVYVCMHACACECVYVCKRCSFLVILLPWHSFANDKSLSLPLSFSLALFFFSLSSCAIHTGGS